jgi:competence protein ComEC
MPLVTAALLAYVCGLLSGLATPSLALFVAGAAVAWWGGRRFHERVALAALLVAGVAAGRESAAATARCEERAAQGTIVATLGDDASPGAFVPARLDCGAVVRVVVRDGSAPAGSRVVARGTVMRGRSGLMMEKAALAPVSQPPRLRQLRDAIGRGIDAHFRSNAPLVRALLIADMSDIAPSVRSRFAAAGLSHMLSVSGLHVGLIAAAVLLLAEVARIGRRSADLIVIALTAVYVVLIGAPLPAVRAAIMLAAGSVSLIAQRPTSPWAVLAVGACAPVLHPRAVLDVGYQLSVAGMVALVASGALTKRWAPLSAGGWKGTLVRGLVASTAATLLTAPLVASTFGQLSFVAPITNLVATPVVAVLQPMLFLAALLLPVPAAAQFVADACHPLLALIDQVATVGAQLPGSSVAVTTDGIATATAIGVACAFVVACTGRHPGRPLVIASLGLTMLVWRPLLPRSSAMTEIHVIDVGQGDAIAVRSTRGRWLLFDAGREWEGGDAGVRDIVPYLARRGGTLEAFVLSHPHADHVGGAASVIRALKPAWYFDPAYAGPTGSYRASLIAARETGSRWRRAEPGDSLVVDEIVMTVLAPAAGWADTLRDPNEASTVVRLRIGTVTVLLTGDAEAGEERWLVSNAPASLRADVLKVAHHGSSTSSTNAFLDAVQPRLALISVGAGNIYRHPSADVVRSLAAHGAVTLRTDRTGTIVLYTDGTGLEVEAGGERWRVVLGSRN